jgi:hypothetical protein
LGREEKRIYRDTVRSITGSSTPPNAKSKAARAATAAAGARAILSLVDLERAAFEVGAIQSLHGTGCIGIGHLDETETARPTGVAIGDQGHFVDGAMRREQRAHRFFGCTERQIANVEFCHFRGLAAKE